MGLLDNSGTKVVEYAYNVWGKLLYTSGSLASKGSRFNMFLNGATGEIILISIQGAIEIATGYFLK